ncbi:glycerophosphodiester phosphodiesterase family protein [Thomasclavelia cocleata]|uniref:glycerophosphodiester phosphodiesterase family protein n=1 Tax=Thomasclavelia cocleata TaxID=69824 RepID=UPI00272E890E|nr:glycerophosphodiester phosphodiesterase family protein [Thomasclavelia cocleata]
MKNNFIKILKFEIFYKIITIIILLPFLNKVLQMYLNNHSAVGIVFNQNILFGFFSFKGILVVLFLLVYSLLIVLYEYSVIINMISLYVKQRPFRIYEVMKVSFINLKGLKHPSIIICGLYYLLILPLAHIGYLNALIPSFKVPNFIFGELSLTFSGNILIVLIYLLYYGVYLLLLFVPFYMILKKENFIKAFKDNFALYKKLEIKDRFILIAILVIWFIVETKIIMLLPDAVIKNTDFNRFFLRNMIISTRFRIYFFEYLVYTFITIIGMYFFYYFYLKIINKYDQELLNVNLDHEISQKLDNTLIQTKLKASNLTKFINKYILTNKFYLKHTFIINTILIISVVILITCLFSGSIYLISVLLIIILFLYFIASIYNFYELKTTGKSSILDNRNSAIFYPYQIIKRYLSQSKLYKKHPKIISFILITMSGLLISMYLQLPGKIHQPIIIGHRGSKYGVENTYEAIIKAQNNHSDYAEIDVQLSKDGIPIVIHDTNLLRLAHLDREVSSMTANELEKITVYEGQYQGNIMTLDHLLKKLKKEKIKLLIELKADNNQIELSEKVINIVEQNNFENRAIYMSLDYEIVELLQEKRPEWWIGYCIYGSAGQIDASIWKLKIDFLAVEENMITVNFVDKANSNWIPIYVWSVDDKIKMDQYLDIGVSGIITNYPDRSYEVVKKYLEKNHQYYPYQIINNGSLQPIIN